ncbi:tyrosine recombinase [Paenibacillus marinisediminis]
MSRIEQQLEQYLQHMTEDRYLSPHTKDAYERDVRSFISHVREDGLEDVSQVTGVHMRHYFGQLRLSGRAASTISRHKAAVRSFFMYLIKEGDAVTDPTMQIELPRTERKQPTLLTIEQVEQLLNTPDPHSAQGIRDRAMLETLYGTGMRITELIALNYEDVHLQLGFVRCIMNRKERVIPLGQVAIEAIRNYLEQARPEWVTEEADNMAGDEKPLFVNMRGQRLTRQGFWKMLKKYAADLSLDISLTPHTLRQSFAAHLLSNGADLHAVQEMLGHADAATTQRYAVVSDKRHNMKDVYTMAHPRAFAQNKTDH